MDAPDSRNPAGGPGFGRAQSKGDGLQGKYNTLAETLAAHGLTPPDHIDPGKMARFPGAGKSNGNKAGWCLLFEDGDGAAFGDWSTGLSETWQARKPIGEAEQRRWRERIKQARETAEKERDQTRQNAADSAAEVWAKAGPADALHAYLVAKGIQPHGIRQDDDRLLVPLMDEQGNIRSVQRIDTHGSKRFFPGGQVTGNHYLIGTPGESLVICEGFATGASILESTGHPVAIAFNAGNIKSVAEAMRGKYPDCRLIIAADDDQGTEGNPGISKATEAAQAINGLLATPGKAGDFNDVHQAQGADSVRQRIEAAEKVKRPGAVELEMVEVSDLDTAEIPDPPHIIDKLLPVGVASSLAGHGGAGKTKLMLSAAISVALGRPFMGLSVEQVPVLFYSAEDGAEVIRYGLKQIIEQEGISPAELSRNMHVIDATTIDPALFIERSENDGLGTTRRGLTTPAFRALADKAKEVGARFIVIDNASDTFEANENERSRVRGFIRALAGLAREIDGAVLLLSHVDKQTAKNGGNSEGYSGSTAWHNSVRSRMYLEADGRNLTLKHQKANFGPLADDLLMHFDNGALMAGHVEHKGQHDDEVDLKHTGEILAMIQHRSERGDFVSTSATAGNAWTKLNPLSEFPKIDRRTFWRLIDQAENAGRLKRENYRDGKRMEKQRFTVTETGQRFIQTMEVSS